MAISLSPKTYLEWSDYSFVMALLLLCTLMSFYFKFLHSQTKSSVLLEFLLASRDLGVGPVAFSIAATCLSAYTLLSIPGELYAYGISYSSLYLTYTVAFLLAAHVIVPFYRKSKYVSVFEVMENRFDSQMRRLYSAIFILNKVCYISIVLYLPALLLSTLTPYDIRIITLILGFVCTLYSSLGGLRTVVWTDVIQALLMFITLLMIIGKGGLRMGSEGREWNGLFTNQFVSSFAWTDQEGYRYSGLSLLSYGLISALDTFLINQAIIQRVMSARTTRVAKSSVILASGLVVLVIALITLSGAILYTLYGHCDPLQLKDYTGVDRIDQILVYAIGDFFQGHAMLKGIAISGIISGSLSTFSSFVNSFAALALEDFVKPLFPNITRGDKRNVFICVCLSFAFGGVATMGSFVIPYMDNAISAHILLSGILRGPLLGSTFLTIFWGRTTKMACLFSLASGVALISWMTIGNQIYFRTQSYHVLPRDTEDCEINYLYNSHWSNNSTLNELNITSIITMKPEINGTASNIDSVLSIYKISTFWYSSIGFAISLIAGIIMSELCHFGLRYQTGDQIKTKKYPKKYQLVSKSTEFLEELPLGIRP